MKMLSSLKTMIVLLSFCCLASQAVFAKNYELKSPDGRLCVHVEVGERMSWSLLHDGDVMITDSPLSMTLMDGRVLAQGTERPRVRRGSVDQILHPVIYRKSEVRDFYNSMEFSFRNYSIQFRAYNSGVAYRFKVKASGPFQVRSEEACFNLPEDWTAYVPYVKSFDKNDFTVQYSNSFENTYKHMRLSEWDSRRIAFLPLLVEASDGRKILFAEADLQNYPGMYLWNGGGQALKGHFAPVPDVIVQGGHNKLQGVVKSRKEYIAEFDAVKGEVVDFPWRIAAVSSDDIELADNDLVYCLAEPQDPDLDFSWVKPGKVAWDWWNNWNLYDVDFKTGINNETYKHYIDFASEHGIPYVILDEGWSVNLQADLLQVIPEIDLELLVEYGKERNVGIILWAGYWAFNRDIEGLCRHFSEMGVKGFKVDFMNRDDQQMVAFLRNASEIAAKYKLILDFHGTHKPTGLQRTWPNAINYEGVHGLEQVKWDAHSDQVTYDVTIPYIRMFAGPFDYTQGAMRNATRENFRPVNSEPMSQGTRCRQLAEYVVFESPFNMLCDSPSNYRREPECTQFIAGVPEVWDETKVLEGQVAEYIVIARRKGDTWYIGGLTDWSAREIVLDLSFVTSSVVSSEIFRDGLNADRVARDFVHESISLSQDKAFKVKMAPGGGFALKIQCR